MPMKLRSAAAGMSSIYLGQCRIGWLSWPTGHTHIFPYKRSTKPTVLINCSSIIFWTQRVSNPNVFTTIFPGVNDHVQLTVTGANCGLPTVSAVRVVLEPKPGLPTDPNDPRAFNDVFIDINPLFVINNESGWYEGWMIH